MLPLIATAPVFTCNRFTCIRFTRIRFPCIRFPCIRFTCIRVTRIRFTYPFLRSGGRCIPLIASSLALFLQLLHPSFCLLRGSVLPPHCFTCILLAPSICIRFTCCPPLCGFYFLRSGDRCLPPIASSLALFLQLLHLHSPPKVGWTPPKVHAFLTTPPKVKSFFLNPLKVRRFFPTPPKVQSKLFLIL